MGEIAIGVMIGSALFWGVGFVAIFALGKIIEWADKL